MSCELCTKYPEDPLLDLFSNKGRELQILEIIQKHLSILEIGQNQLSYSICSDCCHVLCNFHELYLLVESSQEKAKIQEADPIDSSTPDKFLFDELKFDCDVVKVESKCNDFTNIASPQLSTEKTQKRRSKRLNPQNVQTAPEHEFPLQLEAEFVVKNEIITATSTDADADALKVASDSDFKPHMASDTEEYDNTIDNFVENSFCKVRKKKTKTKILLRKTKSTKSNKCISSTYDQLYKSQVTQNHDEFLAKNYKFSCCLCHVSLEDFSALKKHFRLKHNIRGYVICCRRKLLKRGVLVDHIQTHLNPDFFKCSICDKVASDRRCLELHMQIHEKKRERTFQCETCSKRYFRREVFLRHLKLHLPEEEKTSKCPQCEKTFPTTYSMNQHLKNIHLNAYSKICDICGKSIRGREALRLHQQEHAGVPKALVECELCGLRVTNKYGLSRHMKTVHSEENATPQICTICSKVSPTVSSHRRHMNYMHRMERKHACPMCDKAFKRAKSLQEHMTTHTGEVLYTCPHCPKTFNSNANMHSHRKKVHRKEWEETRLQRRCHTQSDVITKNDVQHDNDDYSSIGIDLDSET